MVSASSPFGVEDEDRLPSDCFYYHGVYTIPWRSYYSKNIKNLMMAGRDISTSRMGLASTRIIGCCALGGEAVGIAAAKCAKKGLLPRELAPYIGEVQQEILADGGWLPGFKNEDEKDLARTAKVTASSTKEGWCACDVINGVSRKIEETLNGWTSDGISEGGETLSLDFGKDVQLSEMRFVFHSDFNYPIRVTMAPNRQRQQRDGVPAELVKDYDLVFKKDGKVVHVEEIRDNHQRLNIVKFAPVSCDSVDVHVISTNGSKDVTVFEVRAYQ